MVNASQRPALVELVSGVLTPLALIFSLVLASAVAPRSVRAAEDATSARLVVLIAIDQLRRDRADPGLAGGIGRILREGRVYEEAVLDHAVTATCPGHATMLSGRHPGPAGVPGNWYVDRERGERMYCVNDPDPATRVIGSQDEEGRSPRNLRVEMLGGWMKARDPETRVLTVAGKDRSAIALGGRSADTAWWFLRGEPFGFTTSRHYREELPDWVEAFNGADPPNDGFWSAAPSEWIHASGEPGPYGRLDDFPAESDRFSRTSPHPLGGDPEALYSSPYIDLATLDFAKLLVEKEGLGDDAHPDLLAIGLSGFDTVGHLYGPESHESRDALAKVDEALGAFLDFLEAKVGKGRVIVALTSDHGVLPLPEWLAETGRSTCPLPGGRAGLKTLVLGLMWHLHKEVGGIVSMPGEWLHFAGGEASVNRELANERGVSVEQVVESARAYLSEQEVIARVWTRAEILSEKGPVAELHRHSYDAERSGDVAIDIESTCLISAYDTGTSHGSEHPYDRNVPIAFYGPGVEPGRVKGPARTVDIAPTLAGLIGVDVPDGLDGHNLLE